MFNSVGGTGGGKIVGGIDSGGGDIVTLVAALQGKSVSEADMQTIQNAGTQAGRIYSLIRL